MQGQSKHIGLLAKSLARRAPVHDARLVALPAPAHGAAAAAAAPGAVDDLRQRARRARTPACSTRRECSRSPVSVSSEMPPSGAHGSMRRAYSASQRTTLPMPAATRLVEQHLADRPRRVRPRARTLDGDGDPRVVVEQVGAEAAQRGVEGDARAVEQLEHRPAELDGHEAVRAAASATRSAASAPSARPSRIDVPRAGHAQVGVQDAAVVEGREQVLAARLDGLEHAGRRAPAASP